MEALLLEAQKFILGAGAFLVGLGMIVFVHELGHHLVAKLFGVRVLVFSLGFGKRLWGFERGGTDYRVSALPLGGYVRMFGEMPDEHAGNPEEFLSKPRWQRILVYLAGPMMNVVLAILLIAFAFMRGIPVQALEEIPSVVGFVEEGSPAESAGVLPGDRILRIDGEAVEKWKDVQFIVMTAAERPVELEILRGEEPVTLSVVPEKVPRYEFGDAGFGPEAPPLRILEVMSDTPAERAGFASNDELVMIDGQPITGTQRTFIDHIEAHAGAPVEIEVRREGELISLSVVPDDVEGKGRIGVLLGFYRTLPLGEALVESTRYNVDIVKKSAQLLGKLLFREVSPKSTLSGPIEIASISAEAARRGFIEFLFTMGFLSIAIGFMNLLPIPVLDGGHIAILVVESVLRRDLSMILKERLIQVGFMMLMTLMAVVIFFDLAKQGWIPGS